MLFNPVLAVWAGVPAVCGLCVILWNAIRIAIESRTIPDYYRLDALWYVGVGLILLAPCFYFAAPRITDALYWAWRFMCYIVYGIV